MSDFNSFEFLNHSNVTFGMPHANSIDFIIGSQYGPPGAQEVNFRIFLVLYFLVLARIFL